MELTRRDKKLIRASSRNSGYKLSKSYLKLKLKIICRKLKQLS